jgi:hypothetical protein
VLISVNYGFNYRMRKDLGRWIYRLWPIIDFTKLHSDI